MKKTIILGAGPAGLSAAYHLKTENILIEKEAVVGGLARSVTKDGYIFDFAGHIFFTQDEYANSLVTKLLGENIHYQNREAWVFSKNTYTRYPFQANTYGLPVDVVKECLLGIIDVTKNNGNKNHKHFEEWIYNTFGSGIAKHFMIPYNKKVWAVPLQDMTYEWIEDRVMTPKIEDVLDGALESKKIEYGPNSKFAYPLHGGSQSLANSFLPHIKDTPIMLNSKVTSVNLKDKFITINDDKEQGYDSLISSLPLPDLISICASVPDQVKKAAENLIYTSVYCVHVGINHPKITDKNWIYYPDEDVIFQRLFIQSNASPNLTPEGKSSITAEISYSKHKPLDKEKVVQRVIDDLIKIKFIENKNQVDLTLPMDLKYGYIIFEKERSEKLGIIKRFLVENNVYVTGRFGEWEYYNMDHAILSGRKAAGMIVQ